MGSTVLINAGIYWRANLWAGPLPECLAAAALLQSTVLLAGFWFVLRRIRTAQGSAIKSRQERDGLQEALEELRQPMEADAEAIFSVDVKGVCGFINPAACALLGYSAAELVGRSVAEIIHTREDGTFGTSESLVLRVARTGEPREAAPVDTEVFWTKERSPVAVEYRCRSLRTADGFAYGAVVNFRDIRTRRRAEEERNKALEGARQKNALLARMSHHIRTPMNAISGMAGLIEQTATQAQQKDFAHTILQSADSLLLLINDLLDYFNAESGDVSFEDLDFELLVALEGTLDLVGAKARSKNVELRTQIDSGLPRYVRGDAGRLSQVLVTLLEHAIAESEGASVTFEMSRAPQHNARDGDWLQVSIQHSGPALSAEALEKLFEPFHGRAVAGSGSATSESGLGLAICQQLVGRMGDGVRVPRIQVESGEGMRFWVEIFLGSSLSEGVARLRSRPVLIVEESPVELEILREVLKPAQAHLMSAANALHALVLRPAAPFVLAILDMEMEQMNAMHLAEALRDAHPGIQILLLVTREPQAEPPEGLAWLLKPVQARLLFERVARLLPAPTTGTAAPARVWAHATPEPEPARAKPVEPGGLRILVAEDNLTNQKVTLHQLQRLGHHAFTVVNGREVLEITARIEFDIVLMDCSMPEMDGYEATRLLRLREREEVWGGSARRLWIIALTAHSLSGDRERCLEAGMDDYLSKPARMEAIAEALQAARRAAPEGAASAPYSPAEILKGRPEARMPGLESLEALEDVDSDLLQEMATVFESEMGACVREIIALSHSPGAHDQSALLRVLHKMKGGCAHFGSIAMEIICGKCHDAAQAGEWSELRELCAELKAEFEALLGDLAEYIRERRCK